MFNLNGQLTADISNIGLNRAFYYGDALFDTLKYKNDNFHFAESHYLRLLAGMRQLRMAIPNHFTFDYWLDSLKKTVQNQQLKNARIRTTVWRNDSGKYTPKQNDISYLIEVSELNDELKTPYTLGVYKNYLVNTNSIDNIKTTNRLPNILASIYANENDFDNTILLNNKKQISGVNNGNLFTIKDNTILTPPLDEGALNGTVREQLIKHLQQKTAYTVIEKSINITDVLSADEVFITNAIVEVQPVTDFKRRSYAYEKSLEIKAFLNGLIS